MRLQNCRTSSRNNQKGIEEYLSRNVWMMYPSIVLASIRRASVHLRLLNSSYTNMCCELQYLHRNEVHDDSASLKVFLPMEECFYIVHRFLLS